MFEQSFLDGLSRANSPSTAIAMVCGHTDCRSIIDAERKDGEKEPMDTLGNLVDKLVTVNGKLWHSVEEIYAIRHMTPTRFAKVYGKDMVGLHRVIVRCSDLNLQRAKLMDEIDKFLAVATGNKDVVREQHKLCGGRRDTVG